MKIRTKLVEVYIIITFALIGPPIIHHDVIYKFDRRELSWTEAEKSCREWHGHLVTITSHEVNEYLHNELRKR